MRRLIEPININVQDNFIIFKYQGDDSITYKLQKNFFEENTGLTIANPDVDIPAYVVQLGSYGPHLICGHIIDNVVGFLKNANLENILLIIDFDGVLDVSENFAEQYIKFILSTKSKTISINQNTNINNTISQHVIDIIDINSVTK